MLQEARVLGASLERECLVASPAASEHEQQESRGDHHRPCFHIHKSPFTHRWLKLPQRGILASQIKAGNLPSITLSRMSARPKLGLIAGNGRFPFLVLDAARAQGNEVIVAAIKEETDPAIESNGTKVHWLSLGELSKLIDTFKAEGVTRALMAGQV